MKILHGFAITILIFSFSACGGSGDSSSAELGSGGEAGVSEVSIGELGGLSGSQFDVTFPKAVAAGSITAENFFAVKVSALPEDPVAAASKLVLFDDSSLCSPAAALAASRSVSPDGYRVRMVLSQPVDLPDRILFCLGVISYMDGTSSAPLQQYVGRAQDGAAPKVVGIVLQGADNGQLAYAAGRQVSVATGVPIDVAVKVFFSKPLTSSSVNRNTVMLADPKGERVLAALSYDEEWMMASLDSAKDLEAGATYSVKVSPNEAGCNPLRDGSCKVVRDSTGAPMLTSLTKPFTTAGASWPPCDADGKGALPSCEAFFGAFDKEALNCVPYEGADPREAPNKGVGYSYDGLTLMGFFKEDPEPGAALACIVAGASSAAHRAEIMAGCVPLDLTLVESRGCSEPKLGLSPESVELSCTAGGSCNTAQVTVRNDGGRTLVWQAASCDDRGTNLCQLITRNPSSGSLASGASSAVTIGASGLPEGRHDATITVASNAAKEMTISVSMDVTPGGGGGEGEAPDAIARQYSVEVNQVLTVTNADLISGIIDAETSMTVGPISLSFGTIESPMAGGFVYTAGGSAGTDYINYAVCHSEYACGTTAQIEVTVVALPPVAHDSSVSADVGTDPEVTLQASFSEGVQFHITSAAGHGGIEALVGYDPPNYGCACSFEGPCDYPILGDTITFRPDEGYVGPDSFTFMACNNSGCSANATVSITITDPAGGGDTSPPVVQSTYPLDGASGVGANLIYVMYTFDEEIDCSRIDSTNLIVTAQGPNDWTQDRRANAVGLCGGNELAFSISGLTTDNNYTFHLLGSAICDLEANCGDNLYGNTHTIVTGDQYGANPTLAGLVDQELVYAVSSGHIAFTVGDENPVSLQITASSSNQSCISDDDIQLGSYGFPGTSRYLVITPSQQPGENNCWASVAVNVSDGSNVTSRFFGVSVAPAAGGDGP